MRWRGSDVHHEEMVEANNTKVNNMSKAQCSVCWQDFQNEETMRQLPQCKHVFHRHCIDPVLDKKITCPACGVDLTGSFDTSKRMSARSPSYQRNFLQGTSLNGPSASSTPKSPAMPPSWVHINRPTHIADECECGRDYRLQQQDEAQV